MAAAMSLILVMAAAMSLILVMAAAMSLSLILVIVAVIMFTPYRLVVSKIRTGRLFGIQAVGIGLRLVNPQPG